MRRDNPAPPLVAVPTGLSTVRAHLLAFPNGNWVAAYRHHGIYWSGGGPLIISASADEGKTWSKPRAIRMPGVNPLGLMLANGIGVFSYQRPGVFLTFCGDGKGELWGNDITLVKAWRHERNENILRQWEFCGHRTGSVHLRLYQVGCARSLGPAPAGGDRPGVHCFEKVGCAMKQTGAILPKNDRSSHVGSPDERE